MEGPLRNEGSFCLQGDQGLIYEILICKIRLYGCGTSPVRAVDLRRLDVEAFACRGDISAFNRDCVENLSTVRNE